MPSSRVSEDGGTTDQLAEAQERNAELEGANAQLDDRYKRALADLDNYRKRSVRVLEQRVADERDRLLLAWLEIVDSVERALRLAPDDPASGGMRAVLEQMEGLLARFGVRRVGAVGERFDPERHEAIGVVHTEESPDQTVIEVARSGFAVGDRILRPAQVLVARAQPAAEPVGGPAAEADGGTAGEPDGGPAGEPSA